MKTSKEIEKILEERFYEDIKNFHIAVLQCCYSTDDFLKMKRAIINKAVSSITKTKDKKKRKATKLTLDDAYTKIRYLHMLALQDAIGLNAFQKRKKEIINNALCSIAVYV